MKGEGVPCNTPFVYVKASDDKIFVPSNGVGQEMLYQYYPDRKYWSNKMDCDGSIYYMFFFNDTIIEQELSFCSGCGEVMTNQVSGNKRRQTGEVLALCGVCAKLAFASVPG